MPARIIKNNSVANNDWLIITDNEIGSIPEGQVAISLRAWQQHHDLIRNMKSKPGLVLNVDDDPAAFPGDLANLPFIAVNFPVFSDGRGFSVAALVRERYGYKGDLRAKGHFIRDQMYYLRRCGFTSFEFDTDENLEHAISSLNDFSNDYQSSASQPLPLFRRRPR